MTRPLAGYVLAALLGLALVGGWLWHDHRAEAWATDRARILGQVAVETAAATAATRRADALAAQAAALMAVGDGARHRADSLAHVARQLAARLDSLLRQLPATPPPACVAYADALAACRARGDALVAQLAAVDSADVAHQAAADSAVAALAAARAALSGVTTSRDSLLALVDRAPGLCRIPLLGLRCPVVGVGYGVQSVGGVVRAGLVAGVMIPLIGGR